MFVSDCCRAEVISNLEYEIRRGIRSRESIREGETYYYVCSVCGQSCSQVELPESEADNE